MPCGFVSSWDPSSKTGFITECPGSTVFSTGEDLGLGPIDNSVVCSDARKDNGTVWVDFTVSGGVAVKVSVRGTPCP